MRLRYLHLQLIALSLRAATPIPVGPLLQHKAHYFDLQHHRLRFVPRGEAAYNLNTSLWPRTVERGTQLPKLTDPRILNWRTPLPFSFPFAGRNWNEVYVNLDGNLTFGAPEWAGEGDRDTWPDGTMRLLASTFDTGAVMGQRRVIAPFWGINASETTRVFVRSSRAAFIVTWQAVRLHTARLAYPPLGENLFEVRLTRDGAIEFRYGEMAEKDGVVGVFCGATSIGKPLDRVDLPPAPNADATLNIRRAVLEDRGADLRFSLTLAASVPSRSDRLRRYRVIAMSDGEGYAMHWEVADTGKPRTFCIVMNPRDEAAATDCSARTAELANENTVDFYLPKIALKNPAKLEWKAETALGETPSPGTSTGDLRSVTIATTLEFGIRLAAGERSIPGNLYEVFAYPFLSKARMPTFQEIYKHAPREDDMAVAVTDFRIDDIHDQGASNGAYSPEEGNLLFNSAKLQQASGPIYLGPEFDETVHDGDHVYRNYALAIGYVAHEMVHHWCSSLKWKGDDPSALLDAVNHYHWSPFLYAPAVYPVWKLFADAPYPEESVMGGMNAEKLPDGHTTSRIAPPGVATGLSALDLYSMGLIGPDEVPDTFFIANSVPSPDGNRHGGDKVDVTIADIIAANGAQKPAPKDAQRHFQFQIYVLHEDGRPPAPAKLAEARGIEQMLSRYFEVATDGRMTVVPTR